VRRVFVANRGEIALRIVNACHALGCEAVLGASEADLDTLPARAADRVVCIGPAAAARSYLDVGAIVTAAVGTGCDAVHPGYGFLAERPALASACTEHGLAFVGPSAAVIDAMGNKLVALAHARRCGVPTLGSPEPVTGAAQALALADELGLPVMVKAASGGGGRGMRIVRDRDELPGALGAAAAEAQAAFGDETVYLERYVEQARHVEVQVLADHDGRVIHLGERDCTIQRRHQKVVEEAPAATVPEEARRAMCDAAVRLAAEVGYENAGTVEFLFDPATGGFFFLEMNTRIQVEHPVTEEITGVDIVGHQLALADGRPLPIEQADVRPYGHAIECRITAESPAEGFRPAPGTIHRYQAPVGVGVRVDSHAFTGYTIPPYYDSLVGKLIVHRPTRDEAIEGMCRALDDLVIDGVETTVPFLRAVMDDDDFRSGATDTRWVEEAFAGAVREG
jgi:acetyl-CoA carboxylase, biotin carboxylase subunit